MRGGDDSDFTPSKPQRIEVLPGVTVEIDRAQWNLEGHFTVGLHGEGHQVYLDVRVKNLETQEVSRLENLVALRTEG